MTDLRGFGGTVVKHPTDLGGGEGFGGVSPTCVSTSDVETPAVCCLCDQTNMDSWTDSQETLWIVYVKGDIPSACGSGWLEGPE